MVKKNKSAISQVAKVNPSLGSQIKKTKSRVKSALKQMDLFSTPALEAVARAMTLPISAPPERYASEYSSLPTAVANPWSLRNAPAIGSATVSQTNFQGMPNTDGFCAVFRDPQRAAVIYDPNPTALTQTYAIQGVSNVIASETNPAFSWVVQAAIPNTPIYLKTPYATASSMYTPHGSTVYAGAIRGGQGRFFWLDRCNVNAQITGSVGTESCTLSLSKWDGDGVSEDTLFATHVLSGLTSFTIAVTVSGYYCLRLSNSLQDQNITINSLQWTGSSAVFQHLTVQNLSANVGSTDGIRVTAVSLMLTNEASPLNKQGKISGFQEPQGVHWFDFIGAYSTFASQQGAVTMPIDNGLYGFLKPTQPTDFNMIEKIDIENGIVQDSYWELESQTAFLMMYWQVTLLVGQDFYWTFCHGLEYQTNDTWRPIQSSDADAATYAKAVESLKIFPQFYENPLHWRQIWEGIKQVASDVVNGVMKYGPTVLKGAAMVAPLI